MTTKQTEAQDELRAPSSILATYLRGSISISYLWRMAWTGRWLIVAATVLGLLDGIYKAHQDGAAYMAIMLVSPAESDSTISEGGAAGSLLAGLTGGSGSTALPKFTQFQLSTSSTGVARDLDRKYDMLCRIFRGECDMKTHTWKPRTGMRESFNAALARLGKLPDPNGPRTIDDLAGYITAAVTAETNKNNAMVAYHYVSGDPKFAAQFLSAVIKSTNDYVRAQSREMQSRYVEYLSSSAAKTTNVEQRSVIDTLLLQEERQLMMTEVDVPYAAKILDGPIVKPINNVLKTILSYGVMGFLWGALAAMARDLVPRKWRFWRAE